MKKYKHNKTSFKKGIIPWIKGKHHTKEAIEKNRIAHIGKRVSIKTEFKKGCVPWNKNKKGIHLSPETEWRKGQKGRNWLPVGCERIRVDKNCKRRRCIKVQEPNLWIEYAHYIWVKNNGKIPKGYLIHHIDKNTLNDNIENLALVTRKAHINIHRIDLAKVLKTLPSALTTQSRSYLMLSHQLIKL